MKTEIFLVKTFNENKDIRTFFEKLDKAGVSNEYLVCRLDATSIGNYLKDYYVENGISSLFYYSMACDAVLHNGIHVDEIANIVVNFIRRLEGVKNLLIIDPYFFKCANDTSSLDLFRLIMSEICVNLEKVTFITNGAGIDRKDEVFNIVKSVKSSIEVSHVKSEEFHDRFWIDPDVNKGIVMGTSLNGIGKKIALVDELQTKDVKEISMLASQIINKST